MQTSQLLLASSILALHLPLAVPANSAEAQPYALKNCKPPAMSDFYPSRMRAQRFESRILAVLDISQKGRPVSFNVLESEGRPEFLLAAEKLFMGMRCKRSVGSVSLKLSITYVMGDGPSVAHYFPSDDQVTINANGAYR
jgi:hypothetical protein